MSALITEHAQPSLAIFEELCLRSKNLPYKFPTKFNLISNVCTSDELKIECAAFALKTRPCIVTRMVPLLESFLQIKLEHGSIVEKQLYTNLQGGVDGLLDRIIQKRPLQFMMRSDVFILKSGYGGSAGAELGANLFDQIGTDTEKTMVRHGEEEMRIEHLMSYDEICLSSLLSVSTPTHFINEGSRNNCGRSATRRRPAQGGRGGTRGGRGGTRGGRGGTRGGRGGGTPRPTTGFPPGDVAGGASKSSPAAATFVPSGVMLAQVGARFERPGRMEWCHMMVDSIQNTAANGYGGKRTGEEKENGAEDAGAEDAGAEDAGAEEAEEAPEDAAPKMTTTDSRRQAMHDRQLLQAWANFYDLEHFPTYEEAKNDTTGRYVQYKGLARNQAFFDTLVYERRMNVAAETLLLEANAQAASVNKTAACHIVGLGLGVWMVDPSQRQIYVDCYGKAIRRLKSQGHALDSVARLYFSWHKGIVTCDGAANGENVEGIQIFFGRRNPNDNDEFATAPVVSSSSSSASGGDGGDSEDERKTSESVGGDGGDISKEVLLVTQYAWDGNSYPGNEYWGGSLAGSGDPAAACCSTIPELQNPDVNTERLCGANTARL